ncbi:MAG: choice-of-anchor D domain-containing protein [Bdellovibrionia bacterium]
MRKHFGVITVLSCSLFSMSSFAADLYVSSSNAKATDATTNKGTDPNVPLKTIQRAAALATAGTTVHVAAGTYNVSAPALGSAGIQSRNSGTPSAHIRFVSDPKNRAKIVMSGTGIAWNSTGSYVDIDGFEITGSGRLGILAQGAHLTITNNYVHDLTASGGCNGSGGGGIDTPNTVGDVLIAGNIVRNIGYSFIGTCNTIQGIYIASPNNVVINNIASGTVVGIHQWHGATASAIINNTVFHCKEGILIGEGDAGALPNGSENNYVANNIVYDNTTYGIIEYGKVGANNRYVNNLVYKSGTNVKMQTGSVSGTISQDPMFVKYEIDGSGDYHLQPSSPAIGKGTLTSAPPTDIEGKSRGSSIDLGAYEYSSTAPSPTPSPTPSPSPTSTATPAPVVSLSSSSLSFGSVKVGYVSTAKTLTIKNSGTASLKFTSGFVFSSGFSGSGNCYTSVPLAPGASCYVNVKFKPSYVGSVTGSLKIYTNASSSAKSVPLYGSGY